MTAAICLAVTLAILTASTILDDRRAERLATRERNLRDAEHRLRLIRKLHRRPNPKRS